MVFPAQKDQLFLTGCKVVALCSIYTRLNDLLWNNQQEECLSSSLQLLVRVFACVLTQRTIIVSPSKSIRMRTNPAYNHKTTIVLFGNR